MPLNDNAQASLDEEWITPVKLEDIELFRVCTAQICLLYPIYTPPEDSLPHAYGPLVDISPPATDSTPYLVQLKTGCLLSLSGM